MTDKAWVSLAAIVVAICVLIAVLVTRRMRHFRLSFPVPFLKEPFVLSPGDSEGVHQENLMRCTAELFGVFLALTKKGEGIDVDALKKADTKVLEQLLSMNLLHSEREAYDPGAIRLGYLGWQTLQNYLRQNRLAENPKMAPWSWPEQFPRGGA